MIDAICGYHKNFGRLDNGQDLPGYIKYKRWFKIPADTLNYVADNLSEVSRVEPPLTEDINLEEMSQIIEEKGLTFPYLCHSQVRI